LKLKNSSYPPWKIIASNPTYKELKQRLWKVKIALSLTSNPTYKELKLGFVLQDGKTLELPILPIRNWNL